jgi:tyrosine-protein phosphatase SIW14
MTINGVPFPDSGRDAMLSRRRFLGTLIGATGLAIPAVYAAHRYRLRNFAVVREGVLYRSGQLTPAGFKRALTDYRIKTAVTLRPVRDPSANATADTWEEDVCRERGVRFVRLAPHEEGEAGLDEMARGFLAVLDDPANHPVLVHCVAGRDRTGTMCAIYRMEYDGWEPARAAAEMTEHEFDPARDDAARAYERYVLNYRPRRQRATPPTSGGK